MKPGYKPQMEQVCSALPPYLMAYVKVIARTQDRPIAQVIRRLVERAYDQDVQAVPLEAEVRQGRIPRVRKASAA